MKLRLNFADNTSAFAESFSEKFSLVDGSFGEIEKEEIDGITSYFLTVESKKPLDKNRAAELFLDDVCFLRFQASRLYSKVWCEPTFGSKISELQNRIQALLLQTEKGYRFFLPVCAQTHKTFLEGGEDGLKAVSFSLFEDRKIERQLLFVEGEGTEVKELLSRCFQGAFSSLGTNYPLRSQRNYPEIFEYLGWCSWDAMPVDANEEDILKKCNEFLEKKIRVRWLIIDDLWADCSGLNEKPKGISGDALTPYIYKAKIRNLKSDPVRFPNGMKRTVEKINALGFWTGIWYPAIGYWGGFDPSGEIVLNNPDDFIETIDERHIFPYENKLTVLKPEKEVFKRHYSNFAEFVKNSGFDFIKVDFQSCFEAAYGGICQIGQAARNFQSSLEEVAKEYFDGKLINCMGMASENAFNRSATALNRCSGDFQPENAEWFIRHIMQCSYNSLIWGNVYVSDWDMFWTEDGQALKNAVLRSISGGPVYVSDKLDRSSAEILNFLAFSDGKILRADGSPSPTEEYLFTDARKAPVPFCVYNRSGDSVALASFHIGESPSPVSGSISLSQFGFSSPTVLLYDWFEKTVDEVDSSDSLEIALSSPEQIKLYLLIPVEGERVVIGRTDKFLSPAAVLEKTEKGVTLYEGGEIGVYSKTPVFAADKPQPKREGNLSVFQLKKEEKEIRWL